LELIIIIFYKNRTHSTCTYNSNHDNYDNNNSTRPTTTTTGVLLLLLLVLLLALIAVIQKKINCTFAPFLCKIVTACIQGPVHPHRSTLIALYFPVKYITRVSATMREDMKVVLEDIGDPLAACLKTHYR